MTKNTLYLSSLTSGPFKRYCWEEGQEHQNVRSYLLALKNFLVAVYFFNRPCCNVFSTLPFLLGASLFFRPEFSTAIHTIDDNSFQKWNGISNDAVQSYLLKCCKFIHSIQKIHSEMCQIQIFFD